jgi:hypothetical protein
VGATVLRRSKGISDRLQHTLAVFENVVVPKPEQAPAPPLLSSVAQIMLAWSAVLATICLDD